jgi:ketosteroid isomerase-like protein
MNLTPSQQEIWQIIQNINIAWSKNHTEDLHKYFHGNMVIVDPNQHPLSSGSQACIDSYKEFIDNAIVHEYKESNPVIHIFGDTAIASYRFDINYDMKGKNYIESGRDLFALNKEEGKWLAVWRMLLPNK